MVAGWEEGLRLPGGGAPPFVNDLPACDAAVGQWWRLITSVIGTSGIIHLVFALLLQFGTLFYVRHLIRFLLLLLLLLLFCGDGRFGGYYITLHCLCPLLFCILHLFPGSGPPLTHW